MTTCYVITDSYGDHNGANSFPYIMAARLGWTLTVDAVPGSRYTGSTPSSANFGARVAAAIAAHPDVAMIVGSINDRIADPAITQAAVTAALAQLKAGVPVVYAAMFGGSDGIGLSGLRWGPVALASTRDTLKAGASAAGVTFIDGLGWVYGTGKSGTPTGDGNADICVDTDGVHLTDAGAALDGTRLALAILYGRQPVFASFATEAGKVISV